MTSDIKIVPLGAGQDVGRSCVLVSMGGKNIMFDCGMHMGYQDERRFPDFSYICQPGGATDVIDCLIISHFHLDHCGSLPYFTEKFGYNGPLIMTAPTRAIAPILLEDYRKITVDRYGETDFFTTPQIKQCIKKVRTIRVHETIQVDKDISVKCYYAGHVLGAGMFLVKVGNQSVLYTGDYNMTPDRHLGCAWVDRCNPTVLISESTYATTIRDSKRCRERDFLKKVYNCVEAGGKVLIPVFALGRAQELCILVEEFWERMNLKVPVFFCHGLTEKATNYYKLFITWTNEKIKSSFVNRNMFDFKHISAFDRSYMNNPGPMVVFATPGMLHSGMSLSIFKAWCHEAKNMIIMPGYCVAGTMGHKLLNGSRKVDTDKGPITVNMTVEYLSFSAHADAKGILQLIKNCQPKNVVLVHGEERKMTFLMEKITDQFEIPSFKPANGEQINIPCQPQVSATMSKETFKTVRSAGNQFEGMVVRKNNQLVLLSKEEAVQQLGLKPHTLNLNYKLCLSGLNLEGSVIMERLHSQLSSIISDQKLGTFKRQHDGTLNLNSVHITCRTEGGRSVIHVSWNVEDEPIGKAVSEILEECGEDLITN
ncbi:integrator complex subunit 11-like [Bolinopsis microptera]|uniref:integrator complex subunit 11-like n=1 Tax=Bolinopsis microptera TaxID=2820187 RepID=UPI0030795BE9